MKPKRFFFRSASIFSAPFRYGAPVFLGFTIIISGLDARAGDILRGGTPASGKPRRAGQLGAPTPDATDAARKNARDTLARTTRTMASIRAMQKAARKAARGNGKNNLGNNPLVPTVSLPDVPNGIALGGLQVSPDVALDPSKWTGAELPTQKVSKGKTKVTITQTAQQALLEWQTLNVGKKTTLTFDQSKGGADVGKWIAFNKIKDPSGNPTQILGNIKADGQVYLINPNGIIFGGGSQVNARGLTASSLPINDNLVNQGLLNNRDAQFLFSSIKVPGGADGTPDFNPPAPPENGVHGDVEVRPGAVLKSPGSSSGNGGRIMLVGSNVTNAGTISTESGQTILAAGSQVGIAAHDGNDPSLRGVDVWVGAVADGAGMATNSGIIEVMTGSALVTGRDVLQTGAIDSSTSVNLNGRIDLLANYGAVANPNFDNKGEPGANGPLFFYQKTGTVTLGGESLTRILPDYESKKTVPGTGLPENSQVNIDGLVIHFDSKSELLAPNADLTVRAGVRTYTDDGGNGTIFDADGVAEAGLNNHYAGSTQKFFFSGGQIHVDENARISVAGSAGVFVPEEQSLLEVEFRGAELADSPLQRDSEIRGVALTVDIRKTGSHAGRYWQGTPLGDVTGLSGLIQRNAAQLTTKGGNISMTAGESIVIRDGAVVDVSGGSFRHEAGVLDTSSLISNGRLVAIEDALPEFKYDGVFSGKTTFVNEKFGISETFVTPLFSAARQSSYIEGSAGGQLTLSAPGMAIDGTLRGLATVGSQQRSSPPASGKLDIRFVAEKIVQVPSSSTFRIVGYSPNSPEISFARKPGAGEVAEFELVDGNPAALPQGRLDSVVLDSGLLGKEGFGSISVSNPDGNISIASGVTLSAATGGSISLDAANIGVFGKLSARSGSISLTTYNLSPSFAEEFGIVNPVGSQPYPLPVADRGLLRLGSNARLDASGLVTSDLPGNSNSFGGQISTAGGTVKLASYHTDLASGGVVDVSGGVFVSSGGKPEYGKGGSIQITSGTDQGFPGVIGGTTELDASLRGYSGTTGGSLSIQAGTIRIGEVAVNDSDLTLSSGFFREGGFTSYSLAAIGGRSDAGPLPGQFESYLPAILIDGDANIRPVAESLEMRVEEAGGQVRLVRILREEGLRSPVSVSFQALGSDEPFSPESLEVRGDLVMSEGARIKVSTGADVSLRGQTVTVLGSVIAPGGSITIAGSSSFPFTSFQRLEIVQALPTVHLGSRAVLSAAGRLVTVPDDFGRRTGTVFAGGAINLSGNILAEEGALLDVSGSTAKLDLTAPEVAGGEALANTSISGLLAMPMNTLGYETRVDSGAGTIRLQGSQMLLSDATLVGKSGGPSAANGSLEVSSGLFYPENSSRTGADINLLVSQEGNVIRTPSADLGVGLQLMDAEGLPYGNLGEFSLSRFHDGSFANLSLGGNYNTNGSVPLGGNVSFIGDIDLNVPGTLRLAAGGVLTGDGQIRISAGYAAIGQGFRPPAIAGDFFRPFSQDPAIPSPAFQFPPTFGTGVLTLEAGFIDIGTLSFQNIGNASLNAEGGDIRGNSVLHIAGDLTLKAATVYPTTGGTFSLFAYDHEVGTGSITFMPSGKGGVPLSAGGTLEAYATDIIQDGVLRAPGGRIILGWDGTPGDSPFDPIAGATIVPPVSASITLGNRSLTSVSTSTGKDSENIVLFGISPDGRSWIDPSGLNISLTGLGEKGVTVAGETLTMETRARVDLRGGGDLLATRWIPGSGGSVDILGAASADWNAGVSYEAGDLVTYNGQTWSARVGQSGNTPAISRYWTKVAQSYAIMPGSSLPYAPYGSFNTGTSAGELGGDPGYVDSSIRIGDTVTLDAGSGVPAGTYTLLPSRYALLPGAYLVTPVAGGGMGVLEVADGSRQISGYVGNRFDSLSAAPRTRTRFEVASSEVLGQRADYQKFEANEFLAGLAVEAGALSPQRLPGDAGSAVFHGGSALRLAGRLMTSARGLGAVVDVSSFADILVSASPGETTALGTVTLDSSRISSWKVDSLLIGGIRESQADGTVSVDVRSGNLTVDNAGSSLRARDLTLATDGTLSLADGASLVARPSSSYISKSLTLVGDGALLRVSQDPASLVTRTDVTHSGFASFQVGEGVSFKGESVILDSTDAMSLASTVSFRTDRLVIGSGEISLVLDGATAAPAAGSGQLVLEGATLDGVFGSKDVTLRSYGSIDLHGSGRVGGSGLDFLTLSSGSIRGFAPAGSEFEFMAGQITIDNALDSAAPVAVGSKSGNLLFNADLILLGEGSLAVSGFESLSLDASDRVVVGGSGSLGVVGDLRMNTPLLTGDAGAVHSIVATGGIVAAGPRTKAPELDALGASLSIQGSSIIANTNILLPSGNLSLTATDGDLNIGGTLSVAGTSKKFDTLTRFTNAGNIRLTSDTGDVSLNAPGEVSVAGTLTGGNAGYLEVSTIGGAFRNSGSVSGKAADGYTTGSFLSDAGSFAAKGADSLGNLNSILDAGGFRESRSFRIRTGDVAIDHLVRTREFSLSADGGSILVTGGIDASGVTGGSISLAARGDLTLASGAGLTVAADRFDSAGKGGSILLEAGTQQGGSASETAALSLLGGSLIDLSVAEHVAGRFDQPGSSAFEGKFTGTLHLRAPRTTDNKDLGIAAIRSTINGASSVVAEGFKVYQPSGGVMNISLRNRINSDSTAFLGAAGVTGANEIAILARLLDGAVSPTVLHSSLVLAPGVEIINPSGNLTLGRSNITGNTNTEARYTADWDLSSFRYGSRGAPGILTLRASGDLVFNNTLSDGFNPVVPDFLTRLTDVGDSLMWLGTLQEINESLPVNTQSWSYRLTAGADTDSSDFRAVLPEGELGLSGSVIVGEAYPVVPNSRTSGTAAAIGADGLTANTIKISTTSADRGTRFEVVRTGTGEITVNAGQDIRLLNQFATIYTAGVALPDATTVFETGDFVIPVIPSISFLNPGQSSEGNVSLGAVQQLYQPVWSMAGGNIVLSATRDIGRFTVDNGVLTVDSSRQMPSNWLYRRGFVDSTTGLFSDDGGFGDSPGSQTASDIHDLATSTTWWIDFSNFFEGFGTLGGGNIDLLAGRDIINADAVAPTNARMAGRKANPAFSTTPDAPEFVNLAPDSDKMLELGGGDITVVSGRNIDGGVYYVERGDGSLFAGGSITTNAARTPSRGTLANADLRDPLTWLPTTLFVGKSSFDVVARGNVLLGPVTNPFLLPQGANNKYWYKTYFNTCSENAGVSVSAYGGDITHRNDVALPTGGVSISIMQNWFDRQYLLSGSSNLNASYYQPWLRLAESSLTNFTEIFKLSAPNLSSTSFVGGINVVGDLTLAPSSTGNLELAAATGITGINPTGISTFAAGTATVWTSSTINVSDASMSSLPGILTPLAYQSLIGNDQRAAVLSRARILSPVNLVLTETGSYTGAAATALVRNSLHGDSLLHAGDANPVVLSALGGDITGLTLFSPKHSRISAQRDIVDVAFYLQNLDRNDISLVSAGRNVNPFAESSEVRTVANNLDAGNVIGDTPVSNSIGASTTANTGDIQISGPGVLEVLAGKSLDLGTGANFTDGTGTGITSIGNSRNPNLPFTGADLIVLAGLSGSEVETAAPGLFGSTMDVLAFIEKYIRKPGKLKSGYLKKIGRPGDFRDLTEEQQAIVALEVFYDELRAAGSEASKTGDYSRGFKALRKLFGKEKPVGDIEMRAREIRTVTGGAISASASGGNITMASEVFGNPLTPPGIVTEYGGGISTFTHKDVDIGQARIFTLRGGDIVMWSSRGNIAAGSAPRTVVTAPPTRVVVDINSATVDTDLGGLATGGGIGVLAAVEGVKPGNVDLIAPNGFVDAGDAGIRVTGNLNIAAQVVLNAANISVAGSTSGSSVSSVSTPSISAVTSASNASAAATASPTAPPSEKPPETVESVEAPPSEYSVEVMGYGDTPADDEEEDDDDGNP